MIHASVLVLSIASLSAAPQDVLYDFYSTSCGPCQMMMPTIHHLQAEGFPVVKVNIGERPDLAQRYGIEVVPTFVLVIGGRERQRISGWQDESTLRDMLAQIPRRRPVEVRVADADQPRPQRKSRALPLHLADDESPPKAKWDFHLPLPSFSGKKQDMVQIDQPTQGGASRLGASGSAPTVSADPPSAPADALASRTASAADEAEEEAAPIDPGLARMLASSVRIRVIDGNGVYYGSGVVIESAPRQTYVLTCGHVLRDARPTSRIEVDVFQGKRSRKYRGTIVKYDPDADVGLLMLVTSSALTSSPIAAPEEYVRSRDTVVSIGCSGGETPSVAQLRVTALNLYQGPDTIECTGVPVQGRSGGGLFTTAGSVVGVCTNADPQKHRGVYAGLKPIYELIKSAGLDELLPRSQRPSRQNLAEASAEKSAQVAADDPHATKLEVELDQMTRARADRLAAEAREAATARPASELVAASAGAGAEETEVICIIRPVNRPQAASRVVIVNRASRRFMAYLTGEKDHLVPTMGSSSPDDAAAELAKTAERPDAAARVADATEPPVQQTSAWKPSVSSRRTAMRPLANDDQEQASFQPPTQTFSRP